MDTKFSVALHIMVMISESTEVQNSDTLANSVNTNPSYIRKITALLKKAGIIESTQGKSGMSLLKSSREIDLLEIYQAVHPKEVKLLNVHTDVNPECPVAQNIEAVLNPIFTDAEQQLFQSLKARTLEDVIKQMKENHYESHSNQAI
ncbi:transcriptional regulator [Macrococcoides canis]|uniref:Rrf2 family transcriptional regulator n=1 Tax=Macrococcoides canis TaxID=1855823 RepID=A0A6G5ZZS8_9STAP|nr:Rrf2 family transcriptional regulator [Macrococcus canis]QHW12424.1 Rrf2 family transcriptional regulator [Macrococcus canis]QIH75055.1 transcriptional regulator [Macrococcus canis]